MQTESKLYTGDTNNVVTATTQVPLVVTESRKVNVEGDDGTYTAGEIVSSQTISSKTRTVETVTVSILSENFLLPQAPATFPKLTCSYFKVSINCTNIFTKCSKNTCNLFLEKCFYVHYFQNLPKITLKILLNLNITQMIFQNFSFFIICSGFVQIFSKIFQNIF